jgi:hypothetical protein
VKQYALVLFLRGSSFTVALLKPDTRIEVPEKNRLVH